MKFLVSLLSREHKSTPPASTRSHAWLWKGAGGRKRKKREKWGAKRPAKKEKSERTIEGFFLHQP